MNMLPNTQDAETRRCQHTPPCPPADAPDHDAARIVAPHPEQGWFLRCNGIVSFTDTADLYPDRRSDGPHRPNAPHRLAVPA